jgi:diguanylate cyclase (GGDEF)-like protein/PAS domain S-box-containing protein
VKNKIEVFPDSPRSSRTFREAASLLEGKPDVLDNIMASMGDGLSIQDLDLRIVYQNKFMIDNFGAHIGEHCYKIYERREKPCDGCPILEAYKTGNPVKKLRIGTTKNGESFRFENIASVLRTDEGKIVAGMELVRIVEDRERALDELRLAMEQLMLAKAVYESSSEGIMVVNKHNRIISINPAFEKITGYSHDEVIGADPMILASGRHTTEFFAEMWRSLDETGTWHGEMWNKRKDGSIYAQSMHVDTVRTDDGQVSKRICVFSDNTKEKLAKERIRHMAQHDALTDLPNRTLFVDRLQQALIAAHRNRSVCALLYVDLDHFKMVNDTYGHDMGDELLILVAERMLGCVRRSDTVSRIGGDEFSVLLPVISSQEDALVVAEKIRENLAIPFVINGEKIGISSSIGCAVYPAHGVDDMELSRSADQAMYQAKKHGRNRVVCKQPGEEVP